MKSLIILLCLAETLSAQGLDKGKPIIDKAVAALGGERFIHMGTRVESGRVYSFFHEQLSGFDRANIYTKFGVPSATAGLGITERQVYGKKQDYSVLFLPNQGWDVTYRGARPLPDESWQKYIQTTETNIFYILRERYGEAGLQYDYIGTDVLLNTQVEIVDITDAKDRNVRVYFDHITMLPVREVYTWFDQQTKYKNDEVTDFSKYRDVNGVMWPFVIHRERNGYKTYEIFADSVQIDKPLPAKIFELPPGAKILNKVE